MSRAKLRRIVREKSESVDLKMVACWNPVAALREQNRNVALNILVAIIGGISSGMYDTGGVMVAFLYKLSGDSNTDVGLVQAMSGGTMLLTALK